VNNDLLITWPLTVIFDSANVSTFELPEQMTVFGGERVTVPCRSSFGGTVRWFYTRSHEAPQNVIFDQNVVDSKYMNKVTVNNDHSSRDYNLSLHEAQLNQDGWYICYIDHDDGSTFIHPTLLTVKGL
jgi:Immunoglobulin V-set domain